MSETNITSLPGSDLPPVQQPVLGFAHPSVETAGVKLLPVSAGHLHILRKIQSPVASGKLEGDKLAFSPEEAMELLYCLTTPPAVQRQLLAKGRSAYADAACELADRFAVGVFNQMQQEAVTHFVAEIIAEEGKTSVQS